MKKLLVSALLFGLVLGVVITAQADSFFDDFNRPDAANLGSKWTTGNGSIVVSNNQAASTVQAFSYATVNGFSGDYKTTKLTVDAVSTSTDINYVALILGYADSFHNIFVKVQNQDGGTTYGHAAFYYGNNGNGLFFSLGTPFAQGRISVYAISADTIQLDIDSNFDNISEQTYSYTYSASQIAGLGTGIGLGMYGQALADNYGANAAVPLPGTLLLLSSGILGLIGLRRKL